MIKKEIELLPCTCCGGEAGIDQVEALGKLAHVKICCLKCSLSTRIINASLNYCAKDIATELWNQRVNEVDYTDSDTETERGCGTCGNTECIQKGIKRDECALWKEPAA